MSNNPTQEEKLQSIFPQLYQVKRVAKQISNLKSLKQKNMFQLKITTFNNACLKFNVQFSQNYIKKISNGKVNAKVDVCITIDKEYPATSPRVNFYRKCKYEIIQELNYLNLLPFRDYRSQMVSLWSVKVTLVDFTQMIPKYIIDEKRCQEKLQISARRIPFSAKQLFDLDKVFTWKFVQTFPVRLIKDNKYAAGFIVVSAFQITLLQTIQSNIYCCAIQQIPIKQIVSILKNKTKPNRLIIQIRRKGNSYGIQIVSQQYQNIIGSIADLVRQNMNSSKSIGQSQQISSDQQQHEDQKIDFFQQKIQQINIQQVKEGIFVYQSLTQNKMTSQNVINLLQLLQKAIQFYSARNDPIFKVYLIKMQQLMSNQMTQVILNSKQEQTRKQKNKQQYMSIVDLI